uniref:hypothetical protein n=1 Tax=Allofustis seminis TaxID=166939 RepID=UPI0004775ECF
NQPIRQRLQVVKVDAESGETITMDHAHFKIYDRQTQRFVTMEKPNTLEKTDIFVTNENGYFIIVGFL